ncbi:MAG: PilT/PilU family type 4a pilus ATPase [Planctomycetes bacterium]|nr:PilT/PilU family type 4a pilus ATPase [Planctomycetota bacterium]
MIPKGIKKIIDLAVARKATDIHICAGSSILFRIGRDLVPATQGKLTPELSERMGLDLLTEAQQKQFREQLDYDMMIGDADGRYRVNISYNDGVVGAVIRILPEKPKTLAELELPAVVESLANLTKGLVLITGSTSQGKTTTMSAIIDHINRNYRKHIVTIEDPIETVHTNINSIVRQREVGRDTLSFYSGLRAALRQDPDVIAIGEMRDYDTIRIAMTAAETGVLVLSTLHVISIDKLIERILSYVPQEDSGHIRYLLAGALQGVVHQELLPAVDGGKKVACEVLIATDATRNTIRRRDTYLLRNIISTGARYGMVTMQESTTRLLENGEITDKVAEGVMANY